MDYSQRCLFVKGERIALAKKEFDIVEASFPKSRQVFDKERLRAVWGYDGEGDSAVVASTSAGPGELAVYGWKLHRNGLGMRYKWAK